MKNSDILVFAFSQILVLLILIGGVSYASKMVFGESNGIVGKTVRGIMKESIRLLRSIIVFCFSAAKALIKALADLFLLLAGKKSKR